MDIVSLARFQFAMTTVFHFFFVPFSIGTALVISVMETLYVVKKDEMYKKMAKFWGNIFLLSFAVGVVTGIIQEFQFGMNWSDYSRFVGDIFGAPLAVEALLAFFMESTFLGLWMFTWKRVSPKLHVVFIWLVTLGSMLSALWILIANAFMQHPTGYALRNGRAEMTDFFALIKNPQTWYEYAHVITAAITMGGIIVAGLTAFQLLRNKNLTDKFKDFYRKSIRVGLTIALVGSLGVLLAGDLQMKDLVETQPMKLAATEGAYEKTNAWTIVGWADELNKQEVFGVKVPYMLGILAFNNPNKEIKGMNELNEQFQKDFKDQVAAYKKSTGEDLNFYPPVNALFWSFRVMAGFGVLMLLVSIVGLVMTRKPDPSLFKKRWVIWVMALTTFAPFLANTAGWLITELGRYPWTVYGLFTIMDSVSPNVSTTSLLISNIVYFLLFTGLAAVMVTLVVKEVRKGPELEEVAVESPVDPFEGGAVHE